MQRTAALLLLGSSLTLLAAGCDDTSGPPAACQLTYDLLARLRADQVAHPSPLLDGSRLEIRGESFIDDPACVTPQVVIAGGVAAGRAEVIMPAADPVEGRGVLEVLSNNDMVATLPSDTISRLGGNGTLEGTLTVRYLGLDDSLFEASYPLSVSQRLTIEPQISSVDQATVYLNDPVPFVGDGVLDGAGEGQTEVIVNGDFEVEGGDTLSVNSVIVPAETVTQGDRTRGTFLWSPLIGGVRPGQFSGTVTPQNRHGDGTVVAGTPMEMSITQQDSVIFNITPEVFALGEIVDVSGRGFVGSEESDDLGTTSFRLYGQFTPCTGLGSSLNCNNPPVEIDGDVELVGNWVSGSMVHYPVTVSTTGGVLHASDFGSQRGIFEGDIAPVLTLGSESYEGIPLTGISMELGPVRQICWVIFLPGFSDSLRFFGLEAVETELRERIVTRMQEIYQPPAYDSRWVNVEFRTEEPENFYPGGYAILEIGGPDPNAIGLFGYDNTPGKDMGNLRLWDHVGGRNALGELDGYGYGGVFVESMLFWSAHPPAELGDRPRGAPPADPLFDQIFDPLRDLEVVAGEWPDGAAPARLAEIEAALDFLSNMIADTSAHEFGHSLGLAQPFVPDEAYHNAIPQEGCLMDSGRDRPLVERARYEDNLGARFCQENLWYLQDILPME